MNNISEGEENIFNHVSKRIGWHKGICFTEQLEKEA